MRLGSQRVEDEKCQLCSQGTYGYSESPFGAKLAFFILNPKL